MNTDTLFLDTFYKIVCFDPLKKCFQEVKHIPESELKQNMATLHINGAENIQYFKQTNFKDGFGHIIYENDVALYKTGGSIKNIEICALIVFRNNKYAYQYSGGNGHKGKELPLDCNSLPYKNMYVVGNLEFLKYDLLTKF